jgi:hypothetical protein
MHLVNSFWLLKVEPSEFSTLKEKTFSWKFVSLGHRCVSSYIDTQVHNLLNSILLKYY